MAHNDLHLINIIVLVIMYHLVMNKFKNYTINLLLSIVNSFKNFIITLKFIKKDIHLMINLLKNFYQFIIYIYTRSLIIYNLDDWLLDIFFNNSYLD